MIANCVLSSNLAHLAPRGWQGQRKQPETAPSLAVLWPAKRGKSRISAEEKLTAADNSQQEQQKQRFRGKPSPHSRPTFRFPTSLRQSVDHRVAPGDDED